MGSANGARAANVVAKHHFQGPLYLLPTSLAAELRPCLMDLPYTCSADWVSIRFQPTTGVNNYFSLPVDVRDMLSVLPFLIAIVDPPPAFADLVKA